MHLAKWRICMYTVHFSCQVTVYAPQDQIDQAHYALHVAVKVLDYYNKLFDIPYPLPKQGMLGQDSWKFGDTIDMIFAPWENLVMIAYRRGKYDEAFSSEGEGNGCLYVCFMFIYLNIDWLVVVFFTYFIILSYYYFTFITCW